MEVRGRSVFAVALLALGAGASGFPGCAKRSAPAPGASAAAPAKASAPGPEAAGNFEVMISNQSDLMDPVEVRVFLDDKENEKGEAVTERSLDLEVGGHGKALY
jgi:hypothetical protein